jgi:uncharacterized membrane protein
MAKWEVANVALPTFPPAYQRALAFTTNALVTPRCAADTCGGRRSAPSLPGDCFSVSICDCVLQVSRHNTTNPVQPPRMARIVERNVAALLEERKNEEKAVAALLEERKNEEKALTFSERLAERITRFAGSMRFVAVHVFLYGIWIVVNLPFMPPWIPKFDPTFVVLAMFASVESIFLSTFILITQNRMMKLAERRADLNLQISLLAEHEVTRLIQMTSAICKRLGLQEGAMADLPELAKDVRPEEVLSTLQEHEEHMANHDGPSEQK